MPHEPHDPDGDDLAEIWRSAQHRRTEEAGSWLTKLFKKRGKLRTPRRRIRMFSHPLLASDSAAPAPTGEWLKGERREQ